MQNNSLLRIGVFYDGCYFNYARDYFYGKNKGWINYQNFHNTIERLLQEKEQGYNNYKVIYASWYQGLFSHNNATDKNLKTDRRKHFDLIHNGIELKLHPTNQKGKEKGIDIAMAIDIIQIGLEGKIDIAVLVTGDGDFVPVIRTLMKEGIRTMCVYFKYKETEHESYANEKLLNACNYEVNINELEHNKKYQAMFKSLFQNKEDLTHKPYKDEIITQTG